MLPNSATLRPQSAPPKASPRQRRNGPELLLVASGKGGVGTSIVAALAAMSAVERGERVLLVDASEIAGSMHLLFGVRPSHGLWSLIDPQVQPESVVVSIGKSLSLVAGGAVGSAVLPASDAERRAALTRLAHLYAEYDLIVFDGGARLDTLSAIGELADPTVLLVTSADRLALAANYALVKSVSTRRPDASIAVVCNRHGEAVAAEACEYLVGACAHFLGRSIEVLGAVPDDPCLQAAVGAGMTVRDALDGSPAAETMRGVLARVVPSRSTAPRPAATPSFPPSSRRWS
jgi:MinD-like ATPase involved in chromosome partitioning or flagellar assembly